MEELSSHKIDLAAYTALDSLPANPFQSYIRHDKEALEEERKSFEESGHCPLFRYEKSENFDTGNYFEAIKKIEDTLPTLCHHNAIVEDLYREKIAELKTRAELSQAVQQKNDEEVTRLSEDLFPIYNLRLEDLEAEFEEMKSERSNFVTHEKEINQDTFIKMAQTVLDHYGMTSWKIQSHKGASIKIRHGQHNKNPRILIPENFHVTKNRAIRLLTHEIEVHALRTDNGRKSTLLLLGRGLDHYMGTEEGLAIYYQQKAIGKEVRHDAGFWNAYATMLTKEHNFAQVYEKLRVARTAIARKAGHQEPENIGRDTAWRLCLRVYRGIHNTGKKGLGYRRDHIYRSGFAQIREALETNQKTLLPTLFRGNIGLKHVERIKGLHLSEARQPELIAQNVLKSFI